MKIKFYSTYVYPRLPAIRDLGVIRYRGAGLANCLFVASRAYLISKKMGWDYINPTWKNFSFGPYLRSEKDKRHYFGLFKKIGISNISKLLILIFLKKIDYQNDMKSKKGLIKIEGLGNYFEDLLFEQRQVKDFIYSILKRKITDKIDKLDFSNVVGIHLRLGDYRADLRTDINWYIKIVNDFNDLHGGNQKFYVFSDGSNNEISTLLSIPRVERVFFGNALSDVLALSKCKFIIGSDSTFSGWAAFLGQTPILFPKRHFGKVLLNSENEFVENNIHVELNNFLQKIGK